MNNPIAVEAFGAPDCLALVADASDIAVHLFGGANGAYQRSVFLGGREAPLVTELTDMVATAPDLLYVSDRGNGRIVMIDGRGTVLRRLEVPLDVSIETASLSANRIAVGQGGRLYEQPWWREGLAASPGHVRVWSSEGRLVHYVGEVVTLGGDAFAEALSVGDVVVQDEVVWVARRVDGRILGYDASKSGSTRLATYELPLLFEMEAPTVYQVDSVSGETSIQAGRHLGSFAMDPLGNFFAEQLREDGRGILGVLTPGGKAYRAFDLGVNNIRALAATAEYLFVAVLEAGGSGVLVYPNPLLDEVSDGEPCWSRSG
jgi:hypothetical protein